MCVGGGPKQGDLLAKEVGDIVGIAYFKPGARFAPATIQKVVRGNTEAKPPKPAFVRLVMYPSEGNSQALTLYHTDTRAGGFGWDRILTNDRHTGMDCLVWEMNEHEIATAKKRIGSGDTEDEEEQVMAPKVVLTPKEIAVKLLAALSRNADCAFGAEVLAEAAKIPYTDTVPAILQKLREVGKVKRLSGGDGGKKVWTLA